MATEPFPDVQDDGDEISIADVVYFFTENSSLLLKGVAAGLVAGVLYVGLAPARYEATASFQMASVNGQVIETPAVLVEKMKLPLYFSEATWLACGTSDDLQPSRSLAKKLKPTANRNAPLVGVSFEAESPAAASGCLNAVFKEVQTKQQELAEPQIKLIEVLLHSLNERRSTAEELVKLFPKMNIGSNFSDAKFPAMALLVSTLIVKKSEIQELQGDIAEAELKLAAPNTQTTVLSTPIFAPDTPSGLGWWLILLIASTLGFAIAACWAMLKKALTNYFQTSYQS